MQIPILNGAYQSRSRPFSNQTCVNCYIQLAEKGGLTEGSLFGSAGINQLATTGTVQQINRGAHTKAGIPYFVNGEGLYSLDRTVSGSTESFSYTYLGAIPGTARVSMCDNGSQLMILIPGGKGYIYNESVSPALQEITDGDFTANGNPQYCAYIDGYFVVTTDTNKFIVSALNDGLSWNALDFGTAEADPDNIVAPIVFKNQLFITGKNTIEVFQNIGGAGFPFQRVQGFIMAKGVAAPFSLINTGRTFAFLGSGENEGVSIYAFTGSDVERISTDAIDEALRAETPENIADTFAVYYSMAKADFACFTVGSKTYAYNFVNGRWQELSSRVDYPTETVDTRWRVNSLCQAYNRILVGDLLDGRIGELDLDTYAEYGQNILREFTTAPFANEMRGFTVPSLELVVESGTGSTAKDLQVRMSRSKNGQTFTDEISRGIGRQGEYGKRVIWRRLGRADRFELFRFRYSEMSKFVVIGLFGNFIGLDK